MAKRFSLYHIPGKSGIFRAISKLNALKQAQKNRPNTKIDDLKLFKRS